MVHLGIENISMQQGKSEVTVTLVPGLLNSAGMAHGGVIATLVDGVDGVDGSERRGCTPWSAGDVEVYSEQALVAKASVSFMVIDRPVPKA